MRQSVNELIKMGPLPSETCSDIDFIQKYQNILHSIQPPLSNEEATKLITLFGKDESYGLAWTLLHLIESSADFSIDKQLLKNTNPWIELLLKRTINK
ncbi:hypothetical protein [Gilliamella sp. ESL0250]|uniref:hypothetical protein n=1 Tax=Gilliamella sp. ESL0250 TaxID=2705036 RepID=UPI0015805036|nr:hypothetical protein [Gilliamella sp. ESL0250]NUF50249.1 hypothetical protein [Gilliamella sp. ESL0250]